MTTIDQLPQSDINVILQNEHDFQVLAKEIVRFLGRAPTLGEMGRACIIRHSGMAPADVANIVADGMQSLDQAAVHQQAATTYIRSTTTATTWVPTTICNVQAEVRKIGCLALTVWPSGKRFNWSIDTEIGTDNRYSLFDGKPLETSDLAKADAERWAGDHLKLMLRNYGAFLAAADPVASELAQVKDENAKLKQQLECFDKPSIDLKPLYTPGTPDSAGQAQIAKPALIDRLNHLIELDLHHRSQINATGGSTSPSVLTQTPISCLLAALEVLIEVAPVLASFDLAATTWLSLHGRNYIGAPEIKLLAETETRIRETMSTKNQLKRNPRPKTDVDDILLLAAQLLEVGHEHDDPRGRYRETAEQLRDLRDSLTY